MGRRLHGQKGLKAAIDSRASPERTQQSPPCRFERGHQPLPPARGQASPPTGESSQRSDESAIAKASPPEAPRWKRAKSCLTTNEAAVADQDRLERRFPAGLVGPQNQVASE